MRYFVFCICLFWGLSSCKYLDRNANLFKGRSLEKINLESEVKSNFVYAICHAESSLNANAESSVARGMMQLTQLGRMLQNCIIDRPLTGRQMWKWVFFISKN